MFLYHNVILVSAAFVDLKINGPSWLMLHCPCSLDGIAKYFCLLVDFCCYCCNPPCFFLTWKCLEACNNSVAIAMNHSYEPLCGILLGMGTCYLFLRRKRVFLSFSPLWNSNEVRIWPRVSQRLFVWSWSMMQRRNDCRSASILGAFAVPCGPVVVKFGNCKSHVQSCSIGKIPSIITWPWISMNCHDAVTRLRYYHLAYRVPQNSTIRPISARFTQWAAADPWESW